MIAFLLLAGVTLGAIVIAIVRVFSTRQQMDGWTQQEMDRSPPQVLDPSWLDTDEVKGDLLPSRIPPALGPNWKKIAPRNRLELAAFLMRHPAARDLLLRARHRKPVRIKAATDDDPDSGASGAAATATTHVHLEPRRWPPRRPERS